ncbi:MAG: hypothetical protein FJ088_05505, partial [Deltaproteobacteria bacterium]|nr:hypothetical protein [Deltaproteobacteria bacterium]
IEEEMKEMKKVISSLTAEKETLQMRLSSFEAAIKEEIKTGLHSAIEEVSQRKATREPAEKSAPAAVPIAAPEKEPPEEPGKKSPGKEEIADGEAVKLRQELEALKRKNSKLRDEIDSRSGIFTRLETGCKETIDSLIAEKEDLQNELASLQKNLAEAIKEVEYLKGERKSVITDRERLKQIPMLLEEIDKLKKIEQENEALKKLIEEKSDIEERNATLEADLQNVWKERDNMLERVAALEKEKETYVKLLGDLKGVFERLKA